MPSAEQIGWNVAKPLGTTRQIHWTTEGIVNVLAFEAVPCVESGCELLSEILI